MTESEISQKREIKRRSALLKTLPPLSLCLFIIMPQDLAKVVGDQQEQIDEVETHMEEATSNVVDGLKQVEKANIKADSKSQCVVS